MLNSIDIMGRLTKDPELRYTQSEKAVATFTIACERDFADKAGKRPVDFIDCVVWDNPPAKFIADHFHKGELIAVTGRLQKRSWEAQDGTKRTAAEILVKSGYFCGGNSWPGKQEPSFQELADDEGELPFD